jgi:hypothetical protein
MMMSSEAHYREMILVHIDRADAGDAFAWRLRMTVMKSLHDATPRIATGLLSFALAFASVPLACATGARAEPARAISALIGDAACDDDSQCRTLAVGAKPCGGPEYYLAWSTKRTDAAALRQAADSALAAPSVDRGMQSTCVFVTDPGAYCASATGQQRDAASTPRRFCRLRALGRGAPGGVD